MTPTTISRTFIRARYLAALALIGLFSLGSLAAADRAAREFDRVSVALREADGLQRQILHTVTALSQRVSAPGHSYRLDLADRALLAQIDGLDARATAFAAEAAWVDQRIAPFFASSEAGGRDFAVFLALARDIADAGTGSAAEAAQRFRRLVRVTQSLVEPALSTFGEALNGRHAEVWRALFARLATAAAAILATLAATAFLIFLPLERRILAAQTALAGETARAREAERGKGAFLATMSHEIRTSLSGVIGMTELLGRTRLDAEQARYIEIMRASGRALLRIINDILDFTRAASGEMPIESRPYDPARVMVDCAQLFAPAARSKGVDLILDLDPATPREAVGDGLRIGQVATNLLHNAAKFTPEGHIVLSTEWIENRRTLRVAVTDTGVGIPTEEIDRIFEVYRQVDNAAAPRAAGSGLGLALAQSLVERMDGRIGVESELGRGSTFWFDIPLDAPPGRFPQGRPFEGVRVHARLGEPRLAEAVGRSLAAWGCVAADEASAAVALFDEAALGDAPEAMLAAFAARWPRLRVIVLARSAAAVAGAHVTLLTPLDPDALAEALRGPPAAAARGGPALRLAGVREGGAPVRVLLAEDNDVNRLIATRLLEGLGCAVTTAADGLEAVRRAGELRPDLILMDVSMPRMNGLDAAAEIRRREAGSGRRTPIVALTAHAMAEHRDRCLAAGMDDHLAKPFAAEALAETVARWVPGPAPAAARA